VQDLKLLFDLVIATGLQCAMANPDVMAMDINMPGLPGIEALRKK
jgi:DNA-binding NarL/FixJ family response regulator